MSFINLIMEQKIILITLFLAIVPLVIAVMVLVVTSLRKRKAEQEELARRREARRRAMQTVARRKAAEDEVNVLPDDLIPADRRQTSGASRGASSPDAPSDPRPVDALLAEAAPDSGDVAEAADSDEEEGISAEMQDLLSDVFGDDDSAAHYDTLLKGVDDIDIDALATLTNGIAARLRAKE